MIDRGTPETVYEPIRYILAAGGKRLRAVLVLLACEAVGGNSRKALDAAVALEILHNFTLVHDDVMDHAELRRGRPTIHTKWDANVAILAGDGLVAQAYRVLLSGGGPRLDPILRVLTDAFVQVCEGQGLDKEFETRRNVGLRDYFVMIGKKTARMISAGAQIGGIAGEGTSRDVASLGRFGHHLGLAFQIQDDLLDIGGDGEKFGKRIGGDIMEGKKTYLLLRALEHARGEDLRLLRSIRPGAIRSVRTIDRVRGIYREVGAFDDARAAIARHTRSAERSLASLPDGRGASMLRLLSRRLLGRTS